MKPFTLSFSESDSFTFLFPFSFTGSFLFTGHGPLVFFLITGHGPLVFLFFGTLFFAVTSVHSDASLDSIDSLTETFRPTTPSEIDQETIEKMKVQITYEIVASMSVKVVLKETFDRFKVTDPKLLFVSSSDPSTIARTSADFDKIPTNIFPKLFPAELTNGKTWMT